MRTRLLIGPLLVLAIAGIVLADFHWLPSSRPLGVILIAALGGAGWLELARMCGLRWRGPDARPGMVLLGLAGTLSFHGAAWLEHGGGAGVPPAEASAALVLAVAVGAFALAVARANFEARYRSVLETIVGVLLFGYLFSYHVRIYLDERAGAALPLVYFAGIKGTDIVAYLVGATIGRTRFLAVSPKKTVAGCVGGLVWGGAWFGAMAACGVGLDFPWPVAIAFGIILALFAQIGDLSESLFKRIHAVKDSGVLLPEFGGVLDMIDSLVFTGCLFFVLRSL